jgi:phosphoribosylamine-glycine ligase
MKIRMIANHCECLGLAWLLKNEGHDVSLFIEGKNYKNAYVGIVKKAEAPVEGIDKDTVIFFASTGFGKQADALKKSGFKVFGDSVLSDDLEFDRSFGIEVARNAGIKIPQFEEFRDFKDAIEFVKNSDCAWVFKPNDPPDNIETYVSSSAEDMIRVLTYYSGTWKGRTEFILQEVIDGTEVSSEVWVVNGNIIPLSYNNTWETKRVMNDDLGKNVGCMTSVNKFNGVPWLYDKTVGKMKSWLKTQKFTGLFDANCIVDRDGEPWFLEWTPRIGCSSIFSCLAGMNVNFGELINMLSLGEIPELEPSEDWLGALRVAIPPYPLEDCKKSEGVLVDGIGIDEDQRIYPMDVKIEKDRLLMAGCDGIVCEITGTGSNLEGMWADIYAIADDLQIPNKMYRTDAMENAKERIEELEVFNDSE